MKKEINVWEYAGHIMENIGQGALLSGNNEYLQLGLRVLRQNQASESPYEWRTV